MLAIAASSAGDRAREALAAGDVAVAIEASEAAVALSPDDDDARAVLGLALHAAGRPEEAAAAFAAAIERAQDDGGRGRLRFSLASIWFELGRYAEAESAFAAAAGEDEGIAAVALANAGFAAVERDALDRARAHHAAATTAPGAAEIGGVLGELVEGIAERSAVQISRAAAKAVDALERGAYRLAIELYTAALGRAEGTADRAALEYGRAMARYRAGDAAGARAGFLDAHALAAAEGVCLYMAARCASMLGRVGEARVQMQRALTLELDAATRAAAERWLASSAASPGAWSAWATVTAGFDSNVAQAGAAASDLLTFGARDVASAMTAVEGAVAFGYLWSRSFATRASYGLHQSLYFRGEAERFDLQTHDLRLRAVWRLGQNLEVDGAAVAGLSLTGLRPIEPFAFDGGGQLRLTWTWTSSAALRAGVSVVATQALGNAGFVTGPRTELWGEQIFSSRGVRATASMRFVDERIGTERVEVEPGTPPGCDERCTNAEFVIPFGYEAAIGRLELEWVGARMTVGGAVEVEGRWFTRESSVKLADGTTIEQSKKLRRDLRVSGAAWAGLRFGGGWTLGVLYDVLVSRSNVAASSEPGHEYDYDDRDFVRHLAALELEAAW